MDTNEHEGSEYEPLPFQFRFLEIDDETHAKLGNAKIVEHLPALEISDSVNDFGVHDYKVRNNEVGDKLRNLNSFIMDAISSLLVIAQIAKA